VLVAAVSLDSIELPIIATAKDKHPRDAFRDLDEKSGVTYENGLLRIYEAFFGQQDYIYLERPRGSSSFSITNGRHRVKVAQDLGWDAIPARVKDLNLDSDG
jgi:hypothetical protein